MNHSTVSATHGLDHRILVLAPSGRDAGVIAKVLTTAFLSPHVCAGIDELCQESSRGAGALLIAEEALTTSSILTLADCLRGQPPWSALPLLIMTTGGEATDVSQYRLHLLAPLGNIILLERPLRVATFSSSVLSALRARRHQYQIRNYLEEQAAERQQSEEILRQSEARYRVIAESLPQLVWTALPDGRYDYLSSQWVSYTGISEREQVGWGWLDTVHPEDRERVHAAWMAAVRDEAAYDLEFRLMNSTGVFRWFKTRATPLRDSGGRIQKWFGTCTDIQELRETREALRESEERFRTMANSAPVLIWTTGLDKLCDWVNEPWLQFTGRTMEQEVGDQWATFVHPDDVQECIRTYMTCFDRRQPFTMDYRIRRHDGEWRWIVSHGVARFSPKGEFQGYIGSCIDITDRMEAEQALRATNRELEEFAFVASHDLQEPLRTVNIYSQLLLQRFGETEQAEAQEFVGYVRSSVRRMETLIRDLLCYSRIVQGEPADSREVDLNAVLERAVEVLDGRREESGAVITHDALPTVRAEEMQLAQVFQNLLSNALKYRKPAETPRVHVSAKPERRHWVISVADNGIGFDQQYADRVFGLFKRLHRDEYPGTGIGLSICKRIVERNGGRIWANASPGGGATFYFTLPAAEENRL
jgi:PAS domain S-box-containing protein